MKTKRNPIFQGYNIIQYIIILPILVTILLFLSIYNLGILNFEYYIIIIVRIKNAQQL